MPGSKVTTVIDFGELQKAACFFAAPKKKTVLLLVCSNIFMTLAWYGHLKFKFLEGKSLIWIILGSWGIAFFEYCFMVPPNWFGYLRGAFSAYQLKVLQEAVTLFAFVGFAWIVMKQKLAWNYAVSLTLVLLAVYFANAFKTGDGGPGPH